MNAENVLAKTWGFAGESSNPERGIIFKPANPAVAQCIKSKTLPMSGMNDKRDIHNTERVYASGLRRLRNNESFLEANKKLIFDFLRDCQLGKTIKKGQKKKIGIRRCSKYLYSLKRLSNWLEKPFDKVTEKDMEDFICKFENNMMLSYKGKPFSEESKADVKKIIRKFWKWMNGGDSYPQTVSWIDTTYKISELPALSYDEVMKLVYYADTPEKKLYIMLMFDSGARPEELMNLRWSDLTNRAPENGKRYYMARIRWSKTKPRTISIPLCTDLIDETIRKFPEKLSSTDFIVGIEYSNFRGQLKYLGERVLNKNVYPYLFRHSSVTYYSRLLRNRQKLCYRYGWAMSSKEVDRYIDREGFEDEETAELVQKKEKMDFQKENEHLKSELSILREEIHDMRASVVNHKNTDAIMDKLTSDPQALKQLVSLIKRMGLEESVMNL